MQWITYNINKNSLAYYKFVRLQWLIYNKDKIPLAYYKSVRISIWNLL